MIFANYFNRLLIVGGITCGLTVFMFRDSKQEKARKTWCLHAPFLRFAHWGHGLYWCLLEKLGKLGSELLATGILVFSHHTSLAVEEVHGRHGTHLVLRCHVGR